MKFYDAAVVVSFGGPEAPQEVMPFLERVTGGKDVPAERLAEVARHYLDRGGVSPINAQVRELVAALGRAFAARGIDLPIHWGNRNSAPWLAEALTEAAAAGHRRVLAILTSGYPSYSGCRQYRENLHDARRAAGVDLRVDVLAPYAEHDGFVTANAEAVRAALDALPPGPAHLVYITHAIPEAMATAAGPDGNAYLASHRAVADRVTRRVRATGRAVAGDSLVYCSRSGPPRQPWLEPDVNDHLRDLAAAGVERVVIAPIGFVSDHMEVVNDLDAEALATARACGLAAARAATAGVHAAFVDALTALVLRRDAAAARGVDDPGPAASWDAARRCGPGCCANPRNPGRPAAAERL